MSASPKILPLQTHDLPEVPPFKKLIGPSFVLLGLGLGSGEIILWPYLTSNHGLGIIWGIIVGVTLQFFINMEVERYALVNGESIFVGFARWSRYLPFWFIISTFLGFGWPGIGLTGAQLFSFAINQRHLFTLIGTLLFIFVGLVLSLGKRLYQTVETIQKILIMFGSPIILGLSFYLASSTDWLEFSRGIFGVGNNYYFLPAGVSLSAFLAALAYSGAGGNLNLAQSFYIRDKGYGMGAFADQVKSIFTDPKSANHSIRLSGSTFPLTAQNIQSYKRWWRSINLEHFLIFWVLGLITMLMLSLLAFATTHGNPGNAEGINFLLVEAAAIASRTAPFMDTFFLLITGLMLTATQLTVLDSTSRIITENFILAKSESTAQVSRVYYSVLWLQILFGIIIILSRFGQPRELVILGADINAFTMAIYTGLLLYLNNRRLPKPLRPAPWRNLVMACICTFLVIFCGLTVLSYF